MIDYNTDKKEHRERCRQICGKEYLSKAAFLQSMGLNKNTKLVVNAAPHGWDHWIGDLADALYDMTHRQNRQKRCG